MKLLSDRSKPILKKIFLSAISGTTTMTAYSYLVSRKKNKHFREPQILNYLLHEKEKVKMGSFERSKQPATGFLLHYSTGLLFSSCYYLLWKNRKEDGWLKEGTKFGFTMGLVGISIWKIVFKIHPNPPKIDLSSYLGQLIVAHLIFGNTVVLSDKLSGENQKKEK